ncbi:hypothetical protein [Streptomyces yangpuensis]|uniref:hypothetical protein n=1 Tax=Streptomyces yangpuensis TaxID=1648182 RepID=UPI0035DE38B4
MPRLEASWPTRPGAPAGALHHEAELAVLTGSTTRDVPAEGAGRRCLATVGGFA